MATSLIEQFKSAFKPEKYEDTYRKALLAMIKAKQKGKTIEAAPVEAEEEEPADLLAALKASVEAAKGRKGSVRAKRPAARKRATRTTRSKSTRAKAKR